MTRDAAPPAAAAAMKATATATATSAAPVIFAHLHSSPLVVRRRIGSEWRSLSSKSIGSVTADAAASPLAEPKGLDGATSSGLEPVDIIDVKEERKLLVQCLREAKKQIVWHTEVADLHTFRKVLSFGCRVLHFSGHGVPGKVLFENKKCEAQFISQQELKDLLLAGGMEMCRPSGALAAPSGCACRSVVHPQAARHHDGQTTGATCACATASADDALNAQISTSEVETDWIALHPPPQVPVRLVFVSACHSESVAEAFVSAGVPHVVVVCKEAKVLDKKAMEFSKAFYTALFAGHSVRRAFEIGQVQADISIVSDAGNSKFKLLGHGDHSEALFRDVPDGAFIENSLPTPVNECDAGAELFVGRSLEVQKAYKALVEGARLVSITGDRGVGKTEIALRCAQYATERRIFRRICFARLETTDSPIDECQASPMHGSTRTSELLQQVSTALLGPSEGSTVVSEQDLGNRVRLTCADGPYLLILDGCNRRTRRDPQFRSITSQLLRRVPSLALMLTGDGKIGAMDGVAEKIIHVEPLPPVDAALLFTLRAPRRLKAHEMGGTADLRSFAEHPIIRSLHGHPRTICAVRTTLTDRLVHHSKTDHVCLSLCRSRSFWSSRTWRLTSRSSSTTSFRR
ncbi:hypothetical protein PINS_up014474 [Pythium insidiosum]|nr:hypothetical protein PINS_up014474 [Pythium insidiosum]